MKTNLTAELARNLLSYDPETGVLTWRVYRCPQICAGCVAGAKHNMGYVSVSVLGGRYLAHRLIWLIMTGRWPEQYIDHIDGDGMNNRWVNLRECDQSQNGANSRPKGRGLKGVYFNKKTNKWQAQITKNRRNHYIGSFETELDGHIAYMNAAKKLFGEFARYS